MSLRTLIDRFAKGLPLDVGGNLGYSHDIDADDSNDEGVNPASLDLIDRHALLSDAINKLNAKRQADIDFRKKKEAEFDAWLKEEQKKRELASQQQPVDPVTPKE